MPQTDADDFFHDPDGEEKTGKFSRMDSKYDCNNAVLGHGLAKQIRRKKRERVCSKSG